MNPRPATNEAVDHEVQPPRLLRGRWLFVARAACVALAALTMGLFVASVPVAYARYGTLCKGPQCDLFQLSPEGAKALEGLGLSVGFYAAYSVALDIVFVLGFWAIGTILFWKSSGHRLALYASVALVTFGAMQPDTLEWLAGAYPVWDLPVTLVYLVGNASFFVLFCVFPDGRFVPRWTRWTAAVWVAYQLLYFFFPDSPFSPGNWPSIINVPLFMGLIGSLVVAQIYRYRRASTQEQRQQTKWVVFGFASMIVAIAVFVTVALINLIPQVLYGLVGITTVYLSALLIPLSIGFAIRRHRLWDIDLIIKRSVVYGSLTTVLAGVFAITDTLMLPLVVGSILGKEDPSLNAVVSAVIIAVLFEPLRRRIKAGVDRLSDKLADVDDRRSAAPH
jgi:hypothetical protein